MKNFFLIAMMCAALTATAQTETSDEVDPNFHVYLCFGQSNMEGNAQWESIDNQYVDPRFQMLATTNFDSPKRTLGNWYKALCPIVSPWGKLGMSDYFGRTMVAAMPAEVKVGVVAVAMGGSPIEMFDKDKYKKKMQENPNELWTNLANQYYGGNPYGRLIEMAKKAQEKGVIKGILLHQGCSNCGNPNWPTMVKKIYNDMLKDLGLKAADVPLFVGETERADQGGGCSSHNEVVANVPKVIPTAHVVSSEDVPGNGTDPWHFSAAGYRIFGRRYAEEALKVMGREVRMDPNYTLPNNLKKFFTPKSFDTVINTKANVYVKLRLWCTYLDGHRENLTSQATFTSTDYKINSGRVRTGENGTSGTVTATVTDFTGTEHTVTITIVVGEADQLGQRFAGVDQLEGNLFAIVNEDEGKALYGSTDQNLAYDVYDKAFASTNNGYRFRVESLKDDADASVRAYYRLRLIQPNGKEYSIWGSPGYLNTQPANQQCCFILGLNNQNGQDFKNGAVWDIQYEKGKGFALKNIGTGLYLKDNTPAKYEQPTWFSFCSLEAATGIETVSSHKTVADGCIYNLQGQKVGTMSGNKMNLNHGVYIVNGKKIYVK